MPEKKLADMFAQVGGVDMRCDNKSGQQKEQLGDVLKKGPFAVKREKPKTDPQKNSDQDEVGKVAEIENFGACEADQGQFKVEGKEGQKEKPDPYFGRGSVHSFLRCIGR